MAKTRKPRQVLAPNQPKRRMLAISVDGTRTFIGPVTSARKFGNIRPNTDAACCQIQLIKDLLRSLTR